MSRRPTRVLAAALAAPLVLTACGSATADLRGDREAADAALRDANAVSVTFRIDDPDGALARLATEGDDAVSAELAELFLGGSFTVTVDRVSEGPLTEAAADPEAPLREQVGATNAAFTVRGGDADLLDVRLVDSVLYLASDLQRLEEISEENGGGSLDEALEGAPPSITEAVEALRDGRALSLPLDGVLDDVDAALSELEAELETAVPEQPDVEALLADLEAAITPNVRLRDLGSDDGVRDVEVQVDVKKALQAALDVFETAYADQLEGLSGVPLEETGDDVLAEVSDSPVTGTLRLEDGHYTRLSVPLAQFLALDATPDPDLPDLGASAFVIEVDDSPGDLTAPADPYELDLSGLFEDLLGFDPFSGEGLEGLEGLEGEGLEGGGDLFSSCLEGDPLCVDESTGLGADPGVAPEPDLTAEPDVLTPETPDPFEEIFEGLSQEEIDALLADPEALDAALCAVDEIFCS